MKKSTRLKVCLNHQYLQGSWNFERMQNGGWCYGLLPALKEFLLIYNRVVDKMKVVYPFYESVIIKKPKKVNV